MTDDEAHNRAADLLVRLKEAVSGYEGDDCRHEPCLRDDLADFVRRMRTERNPLTRRVVAVLLGELND